MKFNAYFSPFLVISSLVDGASKFDVQSDSLNEDEIFALSEAVKAMKVDRVDVVFDRNVIAICENLLKVLNSSLTIRTSTNFKTKPETFIKVLIFESEQSISHYMKALPEAAFHADGYFLILICDQIDLDMSKVFILFRKQNLMNVNVLDTSGGQIQLKSFTPFSAEACDSVDSVVVNTFMNKTWQDFNIFTKKLKNLHNCPIKVATFDYPPAIIVETFNGVDKISGNDIELLEGLSDALNFKLDVEILREPAAWGFLTENGSSGGVMKRIMDGKADIAVGTFYLTLTRAKFMSYSEYSRSQIVLVVPPGIPLNAYEKLVSPFNKMTWITLLLTFLFAILSIFVVKLQSKTLQDFVFGQNNSSPYFNMFDILMNGSQHVKPHRTFSRSLLLMFVVFCIIIRTSYQAALFQFLQTNQRHAEIETIDELIAQKYDIYMYESFQELSQGLKMHQRRKLVGNQSMEYLQKLTRDPYFKGATVGPSSEVIYANHQNYKNFTLRMLPEIVFSVPVAIYLPKNHYLVDEINAKISDFNSAGLITFWTSKYLNANFKDVPSVGPKKITVDHLAGALFIFIAGCCCSFTCFVVEIIAYEFNGKDNDSNKRLFLIRTIRTKF